MKKILKCELKESERVIWYSGLCLTATIKGSLNEILKELMED